MYSRSHPDGFQKIVLSRALLKPSATVHHDNKQLVSLKLTDLGIDGNKVSYSFSGIIYPIDLLVYYEIVIIEFITTLSLGPNHLFISVR